MSVDLYFSGRNLAPWPQALAQVQAMPRRSVFAPDAQDFVARVARAITTGPVGRQYPELAALAHWFRAASLRKMAEELGANHGLDVILPRGLVFALAPANVDVLFVYGWFLSLLAGNATIVRVSQKPSAVRDAFLGIVRDCAQAPSAQDVLADSLLISYAHDAAITGAISQACDARMIWGGDATIRTIRAIPLKPTAVEGAFADRFSMAAFEAGHIAALAEPDLQELSRRFANDCLWFAQQACSSPRAVFWMGDEVSVQAARTRFWPAFSAYAQRFDTEPAAVMSRVSDMFAVAETQVGAHTDAPIAATPGRLLGEGGLAQLREDHSGYGWFFERHLDQLSDLLPLLCSKDQTLVASGFTAEQLAAFAHQLPNRALDRIVAPGQATDFSTVWDGTDLFTLLTRRVSIARFSARSGES